jgi:ABC-type transporter Mla maintaining outer membrane lipid asymmetry permease subunit MlaE
LSLSIVALSPFFVGGVVAIQTALNHNNHNTKILNWFCCASRGDFKFAPTFYIRDYGG